MEFVLWLLIQARERMWDTVQPQGLAANTPRAEGTLDVIHVLNEIITWMERSHFGDTGQILPVATVERQAFYDVLKVAVQTTIDSLRDWDSSDTDMIRRDMVTHVIALDTVASKVCQPYYVSRMADIGSLAIFGEGRTDDGADNGATGPNDDGERGHDRTGD